MAIQLSQRLQTIQHLFADLHDPAGIHLHRASISCLAAAIAAGILYAVPTIAKPLLVIAALIFMHTTAGSDRNTQQLTLLGTLVAVLLSVILLSLVKDVPVLNTLVQESENNSSVLGAVFNFPVA